MSSEKQNKVLSSELEQILRHYLAGSDPKKSPELEIRFGSNDKLAKPISSVDYKHVVDVLLQNNWKTSNIEGDQLLRITSVKESSFTKKNVPVQNVPVQKEVEQENTQKGGNEGRRNYYEKVIFNSIRAELQGTQHIQNYCKHNSLEKMTVYGQNPVKFTQKSRVKNEDTNQPFPFVDFADFNFRVAYMKEDQYNMRSSEHFIKRVIYDWIPSRKTYRLINRVRFSHPSYPVFVDLSIVKTNKKHRNPKTGRAKEVPVGTLQEADVFNQAPHYEIELEMDNELLNKQHTEEDVTNILKQLKHCIRLVLSGLQETPYPISYVEQKETISDYMSCVFGENWSDQKLFPTFIGPNSTGLKLKHVMNDADEHASSVSILDKYCVTEKADGQRCILFVDKKGKIYLISYNLKVMFTGCTTTEKKCFNSIVDGEFLMHGKQGKRIFLFAAFDIYYFGGLDKNANVRSLPFTTSDIEVDEKEVPSRLSLLHQFHGLLDMKQIADNNTCKFQFRVKHFIVAKTNEITIFEASSRIWNDRHVGYDYEVDGLIYTPIHTGVGGYTAKESNDLTKMVVSKERFTWNISYKWKPPEFNTIDFLIEIVKDDDGQEQVKNYIYSDENVADHVVAFKTLKLYVGHNANAKEIINPFYSTLHDDIPDKMERVGKNVKPVLFRPSTPYDSDAYLCNLPLDNGMLLTQEGETIQDNIIVEFSYDVEESQKTGAWRWKPLRIREDKTQALREGRRPMNAYHTANEVWESIHYPVTSSIITGESEISETDATSDIYYTLKEKNSNYTKYMRTFHNLGVKMKMISGLANMLLDNNVENIMLIDYAVGKGGDIQKWKNTPIRFVLGIDVHADNIHNKHNGACMRYLEHRRNHNTHPLRAVFVEGNSSLNIRTKGNAFTKDLHKEVVHSLFGNGKNMNDRNYVFHHGMAKEGFHISSCQFALHYFFENMTTMHSFMRNLAECTRLNGYFIGTCFDGETIFKRLRQNRDGSIIAENSSIQLVENETVVFELTKRYKSSIDRFPADETSVGLKIQVYQESIGKPFNEYLVNFTYFIRMMEFYGFVIATNDDAKKIGIPNGTGMFSELFQSMVKEINGSRKMKQFYDNADKMTENERFVSLMNRYFVFKKVREISQSSLELLPKTVMEKEQNEEEEEEDNTEKKAEEDNTEKDQDQEKESVEDEKNRYEASDDDNKVVSKALSSPKEPKKTTKVQNRTTRKKRMKTKITIESEVDSSASPLDSNLEAFTKTLPKEKLEILKTIPVSEKEKQLKMWLDDKE